ncbi:sensor histidine kinase [Ekhidna sp.]
MIITWLLLFLTPPQTSDGFSEDILRGHRCRFEYIEDSVGINIDQVQQPEFQDQFLPMDSLKRTKKFQHYWMKIYVPVLEDSTTYYFNHYAWFDELALYFAKGPPLTKNWYKPSDTSRFTPGRRYVSLEKDDLFEGGYFYLKWYNSTDRFDRLNFQILNGKAVYTFIHTISADQFVSYDMFNFLYLGAVFIIFLYVLTTYFYNREPVYLYYLAYLFSAGMYLFSRSNLVLNDIFSLITPYIPTVPYHARYTLQYCMHLSYLWFAMSFLDFKKYYPVFYKIGRYMTYFFLLCIGITFVSIEFFPRNKAWIYIYDIERLVAIVLTIGLQVYVFFNKKDRLANFIIVGSAFFIVSALISIIALEVFYFRLGVIIEIITFSLGLAYRLRQSESAKISLAKEVERVKMIALRTQMKPHFLFNTINSIRALILKGSKEEAYEHLAVFSKLIRYVLESSESELVPLKQELKMLDIYVEMEKRRLSNDFNYKQIIEPSVNEDTTLIPPLILQPFIENSIIHGLSSKEGQKNLEVQLTRVDHQLKCIITDNGVGRSFKSSRLESVDKKSMAIDLTEKRIALLMQEKTFSKRNHVQIRDIRDEEGQSAGTEVKVTLPLILSHET